VNFFLGVTNVIWKIRVFALFYMLTKFFTMDFTTNNIRNISLLGHSGSGKTSLAESMLFESGEINRMGKVEEGNTVSDFTALEKEKGSSIFSSILHDQWKESRLNIFDTPGSDDFIGEIISTLKVADTAIMVLNAKNGVEVGTELLWDYIKKFKTPTILVINQVDHEKAEFDQTLEQAVTRFGSKVMPFQYPLQTGESFKAIIDALRMVMYVFPEKGGKPQKNTIPESEMKKAAELHNAIVEAAAGNDESLMERYFEKGSLSEEELAFGLKQAIAKQEIFPVFCCSATSNMGSGRIMGFINDICPSPAERPAAELVEEGLLNCDPNGETCLFVFKTHTEPKFGQLSYFKVYSGKIKIGDEVYNVNKRQMERISQLFITNGKERQPVNELSAGDIGVTVKLKKTQTNDTLNEKGKEWKIKPIEFPQPRIRVAVEPPGKHEMEKLMKALHSIEEEDPTLIIEQNPSLRQTILHGQGQLHLDLIKHRIELENGLEMAFGEPKIPYRETITQIADAQYRHKKQSGGAGQFGEVHLKIAPYTKDAKTPEGLQIREKEVEDLPWGGKLAFHWCVVGGSIDHKYVNAIKKGIMQKMEEGPLTGSHCQDISLYVYDGKMHPVDSNDMAFMLASAQAFKEAFQIAGPQILEPVYKLEITCSADVTGEIMGDLQTRRALILGMDSVGNLQKITAKVPLAELHQYSSTLRSLSQGKAKFTQEFEEYQPVPFEIQNKLIKEEATAIS